MSPDDRIETTRAALVAEGAVLCVRLHDAGEVNGACEAARRGGLRALELTLTTPGVLEVMGELAGGDALLGAGTVLSREEVAAVADAGGRFVMSPVFDPEVVDEAHARGVLAIPGAATATEILAAHRHGARLVKVFPAGPLGGPDYLRALAGPLPHVMLVPTSGPTAANLGAYLAAGAALVGIGAEVVAPGTPPHVVSAAAARVRAALAAARMGTAAPPEARVCVSSLEIGGCLLQGVATSWAGGQYVTIVAPLGMVACGIFDPEVCERFGFPVAMAHGSPEHPLVEPSDVLTARIDSVSSAARELGIQSGMTGSEALERLLG